MTADPAGMCDESLFARFFKANAKVVTHYLYYKFGNLEMATDTAQEAFIKLWENCGKVPPEKAKSYVYTVAGNAALNEVAHQKVVLRYAQSSTPKNETHSPEFLAEEAEFKDRLQRAIDNLSEAQRTAFLLNRIDGKKYVEIADMLGITVKAVEKRISGALSCLRQEIDTLGRV